MQSPHLLQYNQPLSFQHQFYQQQQNHFQNSNHFSNQLLDQQQSASNLDDSFLNLVDQHLSTIEQNKSNINPLIAQSQLIQKSQQFVSISKQQISHILLENQSLTDSIQLTNLMPNKVISKIINAPFQFRLLNAKNKFVKKDQIQILLQPYETVQLEFQIKKRQSEIGNIYQTLKIQTYDNNDKKSLIQKKYLKFQITFVKPKLELTFFGRTLVKRIQQHKIAHLQIYPNELNEYLVNLIFSQQQFSTFNSANFKKIQCQIQTKGYVSAHPASAILYQNQPLKIVIRKLGQVSAIGKTSAIVIKPLNSCLVYVIAVKCMEKKENKNGDQNFMKLNKLSI